MHCRNCVLLGLIPTTNPLHEAGTALKAWWQGAKPVVFPEVSAAVVAAIVADWTAYSSGAWLQMSCARCWNHLHGWAGAATGRIDAHLAQIKNVTSTARAGLGDPRKPWWGSYAGWSSGVEDGNRAGVTAYLTAEQNR